MRLKHKPNQDSGNRQSISDKLGLKERLGTLGSAALTTLAKTPAGRNLIEKGAFVAKAAVVCTQGVQDAVEFTGTPEGYNAVDTIAGDTKQQTVEVMGVLSSVAQQKVSELPNKTFTKAAATILLQDPIIGRVLAEFLFRGEAQTPPAELSSETPPGKPN
jgi:hypothetical protein